MYHYLYYSFHSQYELFVQQIVKSLVYQRTY
nr:MAG TPA: hypothetical protein [Crassvirales sp.]